MMIRKVNTGVAISLFFLFSFVTLHGQDNTGKAFGRSAVQPTTEISTAPGYGMSVVYIQYWEAITNIDFSFTETQITLTVVVGIFQTNPAEYRAGEYVNAWVDWNGDKVLTIG